MFIKHAPYYSINFPRKKVKFLPQTTENYAVLINIFEEADIPFASKNQKEIVISSDFPDLCAKIASLSPILNADTVSIKNSVIDALSHDLKTASLIASL